MPKTLILFDPTLAETTSLAAAVAEGARAVDSSEVDLVPLADLGPLDALTAYDAIVLGAHLPPDGAIASEMAHVLDGLADLRHGGALAYTVASSFGPDGAGWALLDLLARLGFLLVPPTDSVRDAQQSAWQQGERVAHIAERVRRAGESVGRRA